MFVDGLVRAIGRSSSALVGLNSLQVLFLSFCLFHPPPLLPRFLACLIQTGPNIATSRSSRGGETGVLGVIGGKPLSSIFASGAEFEEYQFSLFFFFYLIPLFSLNLSDFRSLFPSVRVMLPSISLFSPSLSYYLSPAGGHTYAAIVKFLGRHPMRKLCTSGT